MRAPDRSSLLARVKKSFVFLCSLAWIIVCSFVLLACVKLLTEGRNFWNFCWNQIKNVFCVKILYEKVPFAFFVLILSNSGRLQWKVPNDRPRPPIKRLKPPDRPKCTRGPNRHSGSNCNIFLVIWMYLYPIDTALRIHSRYWLLLLSFTTIFPAEFAPFSRPNFVTFWVEHFWPKNFWARSLVYAACLSIPLYWAYRAISKKYRTIFVAQELAKL